MTSSNASSSNFPHKNSSAFGYHQIPESNSDEIDRISEQTLKRYSYNDNNSLIPPKRCGKGVAIVWFRNDLRVLDNEALFRAWISSEAVLPLYCFDPRLFGTTHYFGFPKTGGIYIYAYLNLRFRFSLKPIILFVCLIIFVLCLNFV